MLIYCSTVLYYCTILSFFDIQLYRYKILSYPIQDRQAVSDSQDNYYIILRKETLEFIIYLQIQYINSTYKYRNG